VIYEWLPIKCSFCKMFGHSLEACRKKDTQRQEWRVRVPQAHQEQQAQPAPKVPNAHLELQAQPTPMVPPAGEDGFQRVTRHVIRRAVENAVDQVGVQSRSNSFQILIEQEGLHSDGVITEEGGRDPTPNG